MLLKSGQRHWAMFLTGNHLPLLRLEQRRFTCNPVFAVVLAESCGKR